ncbi:ATP-binding cassette domain-containing protein [Robbsia andropogonis]|uniref:ABC transporter ATP-binding protein/permease n=1 Tax=Robbsia andropogonis TaxID=28092 RepID=UPI003D1E288D
MTDVRPVDGYQRAASPSYDATMTSPDLDRNDLAPSTNRSVRRAHGPTPLAWLGALLTIYLCAPLLASAPHIASASWTAVDWNTLLHATGVSAASATLAALIVALTGVPLGYWLARRPTHLASVIAFVVQLPLALPPLTSGVLLLFLLGPYSALGELTHGALTDSFIGILLAGIFVAAPFLIVAARSAFIAVDPMFEDVAATLGHRPYARFFSISLPLAWPAIRAGLLLTWLRAFGEFGATVMVAYHPYSLPIYTYVAFGSVGLPAMLPIIVPTLGVSLLAALLVAINAVWKPSRRAPRSQPVKTPANHARPGPPTASASIDKDDATKPDGRSIMVALDTRIGDFSLKLRWAPKARRLAILGESGSGKSMTLRLFAGLARISPGGSAHIIVDGIPIQDLPAESRHIAYVPQDFGLFPHMTVAQQWAYPRDAHPGTVQAWSRRLALAHLTDRFPAELSFGQRQRVSIVRAMSRHCGVILMDEPFSALDTPRRRALRTSLRQLQQEIDAVTVLVTHDPDEAAQLADEILVLDHGRMLQAGPTLDVFTRPANMKVASLLGLSNVGVGELDLKGRIDIGGGIRFPVAWEKLRGLEAGARVMWRLNPDAVRRVPGGTRGNEGFAALIEEVLLEGGQVRLAVRVGDSVLKLRPHTWRAAAGLTIRIDLDNDAVDVWPLADHASPQARAA